MRSHGLVTGAVSILYRLQGFGQAANLVYLYQESISDTLFNTASQALGVGYEQVVAHQLNFVTDMGSQSLPGIPFVLRQRILNGYNRVLGD